MARKASSLHRKIFVCNLITTILLVLAVSFVTYRNVSQQIHRQIVERGQASAKQLANEANQKLALTNYTCVAIARNDLIINGVVDLDHRRSTLQSFIGSLEMPGARAENVAMTNYRGMPIAIKFRERADYLKSRSCWLPTLMNGDTYVGIHDELLVVGAPVIYGGRPEAAIISTFRVSEFFSSLDLGTEENVVALNIDGEYFFSTHTSGVPVDSPTDPWMHVSKPIDQLPGLVVTLFESHQVSNRPLKSVRTALIACTTITCVALACSMWMASWMAVQPIRTLTAAVQRVRETGDLSLRVNAEGSVEFQALGTQFNAMLRQLESTTVSREQFRKLALVAKYTDNAVIITNSEGKIEWVNEGFERISGYEKSEVLGKRPASFQHGERTDPETAKMMNDRTNELRGFDVEVVNYRKSGEAYWGAVELRPIRDEQDRVTRFIAIESDITPRKNAEEEKDRLSSQLQRAAHHAGMAEIATGVLHNIGNVLNSINVSVRILQESLSKSNVTRVPKIVETLRENEHNLAEYLKEDEQGKKLITFIAKLSEVLVKEKDEVTGEVKNLMKNVDLVGEIVSSQQSLAQSAGVSEPVNIAEMLEDILSMQSPGITTYQINIERHFENAPTIVVEKHKLMQVIVNLITNAKQSLRDSDLSDRTIAIFVEAEEKDILLTVQDNGIGISPNNLRRIFSHGFTTKNDGHGFGLHSSANAAQEIGGTLSVHSDGPNCGASFVLRIPRVPNDIPNMAPTHPPAPNLTIPIS